MASRSLTNEEITLAQSIYGSEIDYTIVKIHDTIGFVGQPSDRAAALYGEIYFPSSLYSNNFGVIDSANARALFIHELGHVFQHQHGMSVELQRMHEGGHYNYEDIFDGIPLKDLPVEAQAEFFRDLFIKRLQAQGIPAVIITNKEDGFGRDYLDPSIPLSAYEAVLPSNFPDGNPSIPPLNHFDPYKPPMLNGMLPHGLAPYVGMQNGNGGIQFPAGNGGGAEPLILDLNGDGAHSTRLGYGSGELSSVYFDMDNDGFAERTAWVSAGDGLLVMDKNGNGKIDNQTELFGNDATYANGFLNLKQYDSNNDNVMNASDTQWGNLRVWVDANGDGVTDAGEVKTLSSLGITQINLAATILTDVWDNENEVGATSTFTMNGQTHEINDVWFRVDQTSSHYMGDVTLDIRTLFLPTLKGFGNLKDLHVAMSQDETLLNMVQSFVSNTTTMSFADNSDLNNVIRNIVFRWVGVDGISTNSNTQGLNTQTMLVLEAFTGYKTSLLNNVPLGQNVGGNEGAVQAIMLSNLLEDVKSQLLVQTFGGQIFEKGSYSLVTGGYSEMPIISAAGIAQINSDLNGIVDSYERLQYWQGLNIFLTNLKPLGDYTQLEIQGLNDIWATKGPYSGTWYGYFVSFLGQRGWYFNGSNLSDNLVGIDDAPVTIWGNGGLG